MTILSFGMIAIAPFLGSFFAVVAMRYPENRSIVVGRSACDSCGHTLAMLDLIPLVSWATLRGRCRYCASAIPSFHLYMELAALGIAVWAATVMTGWVFAITCAFGWTLLTLAAIDWRNYLLPDIFTLPLLICGLAIAYIIDWQEFPAHAIGALAGFALFAGIAILYRKLRGREGLGLGDAKLLAALGAWVSWTGLATVLLLAGMIGLALVLVRSLAGKRITATDRLPFGAFLAAAGWIVWLYGPLVPG
jgi:leader peptidase (prepilin peptidase) / N-methyltransferase